ncbi:hypothetical protein H257_13761 [Aphanomyces astaci]|uniref:Major facilitator superfamily (MFS) profile domain-containing protein n=2 Tax=Aphanomyces astaci TaxID=112090 RepID=W4FUM5_APHAT|nr:hypothetical protein H257_13761 [Aphanomyces astaci]ETV70646.1 hypothetical protein H257_13761 [Aphanomyces astaci]|eukprot:XP_009839710.1 hypothetical protein H257_13761 [Aphanomyces astaci]
MSTKNLPLVSPDTATQAKDATLLKDLDGEIPQHVLDDIHDHRRFIWWSLLFLNGSVLWAYYSGLSAQDYYAAKFSAADFNFAYLTTPVSTWPMFVGHALQLFFGWDKKINMWTRVMVGYVLFIGCALIILAQEAFNTSPSTGATLVLLSLGMIGAINTLTESAFYALSALFPDSSFTTAIQIGNGASGVINITLSTIIRLLVGGTSPAPEDKAPINSVSFYIFFSILIVVCVVAMYLFTRLIKVDGVKYLLERNDAETRRRAANSETLGNHLARLWRITTVIMLPFVAQFIIFLVSLTVFPGIGCSSGFQYAAGASWANWYCAPGIIATYNYGDFFGRLLAPLLLTRIDLKWCFGLTWLRWAFLVLLLIGLPGADPVTFASPTNSLFVFQDARAFGQFWQLFLNVLIGLTNGILSTITFALGPRLVPQEDRESAGALMVLALFFGISSGATVGWQFGSNHWFGA